MDSSGRNRRDVVRPPTLRVPAALPKGPRLYSEPSDLGYKGPTSEPPPGFVRGTTSKTEWMIYHALSRVLGEPKDPRQPPFIGMPGMWAYQKAWDEGRRAPGGSVIDFVVYSGSYSMHDIALRIQTEAWHLYTDYENQAHDALQFARLSEYMEVIDLYDFDFAWDQTNQAACILIRDALNGRISPNPITSGTTMRVTRMNTIST